MKEQGFSSENWREWAPTRLTFEPQGSYAKSGDMIMPEDTASLDMPVRSDAITEQYFKTDASWEAPISKPDPVHEGLVNSHLLADENTKGYLSMLPDELLKKGNAQILAEQQRDHEREQYYEKQLEQIRAERKATLRERWINALHAKLGDDDGNPATSEERQTLSVMVDRFVTKGIEPDEAYLNSFLSDEKRLVEAEKLSKENFIGVLTQEKKDAILRAHDIGKGQLGKNNQPAGVYNYTPEQIKLKKEILEKAGFSKEEIKVLLDRGIAGASEDAEITRLKAMMESLDAQRNPDELTQLWGLERKKAEDERKPFPSLLDQAKSISQGQTYEEFLDARRAEKGTENVYGKRIREFSELVGEIEKHDNPNLWGKDGEYPLYKIENNKVIINPANFRKWVMWWTWKYHSDSPDDQQDFMQKIQLLRGSVGNLSLGTMLYQDQQYFKVYEPDPNDPTKVRTVVMDDLVEQIKRDIYAFTITKNFDIAYRKGGTMGGEEELLKLLNGLHADNPFMKPVWDKKSILYWMFTQPFNYVTNYEKARDKKITTEEFESDIKFADERAEQDTYMGSANAGAFLVYRNITNVEYLRNLLGADSILFDRERIKKLRDSIATKVNVKPQDYIPDAKIDAMFTAKKGEVMIDVGNQKINSAAFIDLYNIWASVTNDVREENLVRNLVQEAIHQAYGLGDMKRVKGENETESLPDPQHFAAKFAETMGYYSQRWTGGAALNDLKARAFDAQSRWINTFNYRFKQLTEERGGFIGNIYNLFHFERLMADILTGTSTLSDEYARDEKTDQVIYAIDEKTGQIKKDADGKPVPLFKKDGNNKNLKKPPIRVIEEVALVGRIAKLKLAEEDITPITSAFRTINESKHTIVRDIASQLFFANNTEQKYGGDHMARAAKIFDIIMTGTELDFSKFAKQQITLINGIPTTRVEFDRAAFGEAFQEKFMKPFRYGYNTWAQLDFTQRVDVWNTKTERYEKKYLVEAMFGDEILNIHEFQGKDKDGNTIIDVSKIQSEKGKIILYKQLVKGYLAAQLYAHRTKISTDPFKTPDQYVGYFDTILDAVKRIPSGIEDFGTETDLTSIFPKENFFTEEDIEWIREHSKTEEWRLFRNEFFHALLHALLHSGQEMIKSSTTHILK